MVRVLLADDLEDIRTLLTLVLRNTGGVEVVGQAADGEQAIALAHSLRPDVVVLDLDMPGTTGWYALPEIRRRVPTARVIVYSAVIGAQDEETLLASGAHAVVRKDGSSLSTLVEAISSVTDELEAG
ncbi:MAG TPA: response regulator transcription factor [Acidimicrobiales bacterium]|nr:response regulator transcription factor [Acidimicrobiales bacterium]